MEKPFEKKTKANLKLLTMGQTELEIDELIVEPGPREDVGPAPSP